MQFQQFFSRFWYFDGPSVEYSQGFWNPNFIFKITQIFNQNSIISDSFILKKYFVFCEFKAIFPIFHKNFWKEKFWKIKLKIFKSFLEFFLKNTNLFLEHFDLNSIFKTVMRNIFHPNFQKQKTFELKWKLFSWGIWNEIYIFNFLSINFIIISLNLFFWWLSH